VTRYYPSPPTRSAIPQVWQPPTAEPGTWLLPLSCPTPPLTLNQRLHWADRAARAQALIDEVILRARTTIPRVGLPDRLFAQLHYAPRRAGRRDVDNLVGTSKPCIDGLVRAGVVLDDSPAYLEHRMPVIEAPTGGRRGALWLVVGRAEVPR